MWKRAILGYYSVQEISDEELDEIVFDHFIYLNDKYEKEKTLIPDGNLIEISYEALKADPFETIRTIYSRLDLPYFELMVNELKSQIEKEKDYRNFQFHFDEITLGKIEKKWGKFINQWNYNSASVS